MDSVRLGEIIRVRHGFAFPGADFSDDVAYPTLVTPGNFAIGGGFKLARPKTFAGKVSSEYVLRPGALIVTMTDLSKEGATLGLSAIVPGSGTFLHNQRIGLVEALDETAVDLKFLNYFLRTESYRAHVLATASGSTVRHTSPSRIESFVAKLPAPDVQKAIAEVLGAFDDKIAANDLVAEAARDLARTYYNRVVSGTETVAMAKVLEPILGGTPSRADLSLWDGSIPWVSAKDIANASHGVVLATSEGISADAASTKRLRALPASSVVLTARGTVGEVARLGVAASVNQSCYAFVPRTIPSACLAFMVENAALQARAMAHGSVFDTITMRTFEHVQIPRLNASEWPAIEVEIAPLLAVTTQAVTETTWLTQTRDELLPLLMSGKVRVRDVEQTVGDVL